MQTLKKLFIIPLILFYGCQVKPQPIEYGADACYFCKMTIVDRLYAAEVVTHKGKVYKFDATECMINFRKDFDTEEIALFLSNNYSEAESLIDATQATFLISENLPSPMGAFLTAFKNKADAEKVQTEKGGTLYDWESLLDHFKN